MNPTKELIYIENYIKSENRKPRHIARAEIEVQRHTNNINESPRATEEQKQQAHIYSIEIDKRISETIEQVGLEKYQLLYNELEALDKSLGHSRIGAHS